MSRSDPSSTQWTSDAPAKDPVTSADLLEHEYDGIREYDNPTPGWWHIIFLGSVMFSILYFAFFHLSPVSWSVHDSWKRKEVAEFKRVFGGLGELAADDATIAKLQDDAKLMAVAKGMFESTCAACHAKDGGGINGVNLTDDYYKSVKNLTDIYTVITKGANAGAMPAHETKMTNNERVLLSAYVATLRGTTPAAPKGPEGEKLPPFGAAGSAAHTIGSGDAELATR